MDTMRANVSESQYIFTAIRCGRVIQSKAKEKNTNSIREVILSFNNFLLLLFFRHQQNLLCIEIWLL